MELSLLNIIHEAERIIENIQATLDYSEGQLTQMYAEMNAIDVLLEINKSELKIN